MTISDERPASERAYSKVLRKSADMRREFFDQREIALKSIRVKQEETLRHVAEVQENVNLIKDTLQARAKSIVLHAPVNQRIDRGLVQLERLVQKTRDALMARGTSDIMGLDPELQEEIEAESQSIMNSKFFKAIVKQSFYEEED